MGKAGYLGPKATFTHIAVQAILPNVEHVPYYTIPACIDAVEQGDIEYGIVPLENALEGSVNITLDYLIHQKRLPIVGELILPISQHLMVHPRHADSWKDIEQIYSHSHAIAQCHQFLHKYFMNVPLEDTTSTAYAAKYVRDNPERAIGAIANELAAEEYGLTIVKRNIHDHHYNTTKFVVLHREGKTPPVDGQPEGHKTTIMVTLPSDQAGALHQVLSAFAWRKLNLTKIESRPMKTGLGNYFFIIDIDQPLDGVLIPGTIAELEALGCAVYMLGTYPYFILK